MSAQSKKLGRSGRVEYRGASSLIRLGKGVNSANDSLEQKPKGQKSQSTTRVYVTRARVDAIREAMDDRHWAVLSDVRRLGVVSGQQIQRLHYPGSEAGRRLARKDLAKLVRRAVLSRLNRSVGGERAGSAGYVYAVGVAGQRLLNPDRWRYRPPWTPKPGYLIHPLAVSELYVGLREAERICPMTLAEFVSEPACWRHYTGPGGARLTLNPDATAVAQLPDFEDHYFIEMDCSTESGPRITAKARIYIRYWQSGREEAGSGIFPYVLWIAPDQNRADFLVKTLATLPPEHWQLFMVATADQAVERIATGTNVPIANRKEVNS